MQARFQAEKEIQADQGLPSPTGYYHFSSHLLQIPLFPWGLWHVVTELECITEVHA